jgi:hypothetical protein
MVQMQLMTTLLSRAWAETSRQTSNRVPLNNSVNVQNEVNNDATNMLTVQGQKNVC